MKMRAIAEEILLKQENDAINDHKPEAYGDLASDLHELRVHQIELEMHNEELLRLQIEADVLRARYFDLYDLAPVALLTLSDIGIIKAANYTAESLLGLSGSDMINQSIAQVIYQEDYARFRAYRKALFETGASQTFELRFKKPDSEIIWVQVVAALMIGESTPVGWIALNDITKRKEAESHMLIAKQEIEFAKAMRLQMNELQSQLKPHFIFNALSAVIALCYTDGPKAADLLMLFSRYLRLIFNVEDYEIGVTVKKTVDLVEVYSALEKSRFGDKLQVVIEVDPALLNVTMIPLVVQPLVENAIRHGISKKIEGGTVRLRIKRLKDNIEILICDDGVGMPPNQVKTLLHDDESPIGIGISNINQRVLGQSGKPLKIRSTQGKGTLVRVLLPLVRK